MFESALIASTASCQLKQASADVAGCPSDHFIPVRMWKVTLSGARSHESAKPGTGSRFGPKSTSRL